ncbi:MAG: PAS domain S-box protein, partial [Bacteroidales bacterium]
DSKSREQFIRKLRKGPVINEELVFYDKKERAIDVLISASPVQIHSEDLLISIFRDITEIKENERKLSNTILQLQQTEEKFNAFLEHSPDGITLTNDKGDIIDWNRSMEKFTGISRDYVLGKSWSKIQKQLDEINIGKKVRHEKMENQVNKLTSKDSDTFQKKFEISLLPDGESIIHLENIIFNISGAKGNRIGLISRDITQEKLNRENVHLYKQIFNHNEDGIAILNSEGNYREINHAYSNIAGFSIDELKGKNASILIGKKTYSEVFKVYQFQGIFEGELKATTRAGKNIYLDILMFPVISNNITLCIVQIIRDITNRKKAESELINAMRKAEEADQLKTAFLSNMSHEIRTPMNSILGFSSLLENPDITHDQRNKYIQFINRNGENLLNLIGDIIDIAKIESNQLKISKTACNIHELLEELKENMSKIIDIEAKEHIDLKLNYNRSYNLFLFTDPYRLRQILANLVYNAIKFTIKGYIEFGYNINNEREVLFYVKDTGRGIPDEMQEKIFERFHKLESSKIKLYGGAGLGLAISNQLLKLLGGKIWLESEEGEGTTFYFTLPLITIDEEGTEKPGEKDAEVSINFSNKKFLIVEDDQYNADLFAEYLNKTGANVIFTGSGKKAVNIYTDNPDINLIMMDIRLPEMNGIEAARLLHEINPELPVIALTAYALDEDREIINSAGFIDIIIKPVSKRNFLQTIDYCIKKQANP